MRDWHTGLRLGANKNGDLAENVEVVAEVEGTQRGGLTTFHGPGQVVVFPVIDLKGESIVNSPSGKYYKKGLDVRSYVCLLEDTTIGLLKGEFGISGKRTENPGVWVDVAHPEEQITTSGRIKAFARELRRLREGKEEHEPVDCKIAALGVHLRRYITSYGLAINCSTDLRWFDRITACGLEGLGTTTIRQLGSPTKEGLIKANVKAREDAQQELAGVWARRFASGIWGIPGPFGKRAHENWNEVVQSRVWGADMDGSGEGLGIEDVPESLQNTAGKWPLAIPDPVPRERILSKNTMERARQRRVKQGKTQWAQQNTMKLLDDEIREIKKQIEGKKLDDRDISLIVKGLGRKMMDEHKSALDKAKEVTVLNAKKTAYEKKLERAGYRLNAKVVRKTTSTPGGGASLRRPLLHELLRKDDGEKVEDIKKIVRDLETQPENTGIPDKEKESLRNQINEANYKIRSLEKEGKDDGGAGEITREQAGEVQDDV